MLYLPRNNNTALKYWLFMGIASLALAGVFAILLVTARSPVIQDIIPVSGMFHKALTIHVNLSVLVWFLSMTCVLWQLITPSDSVLESYFERVSIFFNGISVILIVISPFAQEGKALLNNYVPILDNKLFRFGIGLFLFSIAMQAMLAWHRYHLCIYTYEKQITLFRYATISSVPIYLLSVGAIALAYMDISHPDLDFSPEQFYELLFWGSGHMLQFLYVQIMVLSWWWLASLQGMILVKERAMKVIFALNVIFVVVESITYKFYYAYDPEHLRIFTKFMEYFGGLVAILFGTPLTIWLIKNRHSRNESTVYWPLIWSIVMFAIGGILAFMIHGVNTVIPAHYHGSIVGVTLALMAMCYVLLPILGYNAIHKRVVTLQSFIYSIGQLMHIIGLAWSGGYGALRKTPGAMHSVDGQAAMGLMGLGGLLSVIGGVFFVVICGLSIFGKQQKP